METTQNFGLVYLLSNPAMPGIYKIGTTTRSDIAARMNELYTTGVPTRFECVKACRVANCAQVEKALHQALHLIVSIRPGSFSGLNRNKYWAYWSYSIKRIPSI